MAEQAPSALDTQRRTALMVGLLLAAATCLVFAPLAGAGFVSFDDPEYVTGNARVLQGLTWDNVRWAFETLHFGYYYPLTWLSHMADCHFFGTEPRAHHLHSLALHCLNGLLLFWFLRRTTGSTWRSALASALFALHPLHVESVAWIAERKDVLSTCYLLLTLIAYAWYARAPGWRRYLLVAALFACGLMAKPMLVTLPCALLLLDVWPLGRTALWQPPAGPVPAPVRVSYRRLVLEKLPLLALSAAASYLTLLAQRSLGAVTSLDTLPLSLRLANAAAAYGGYLGKMVIPVNLSILYPYPRHGVPTLTVVFSLLLIALASGAALLWMHRAPYLAVGWAWYLGTLVPVIGLLQVGRQSMADRYTYVPLIGLFVALAWAAGDLARRGPGVRWTAVSVALVALMALSWGSWKQVGIWKDTLTLFGHAADVTEGNAQALAVYGLALSEAGRTPEALRALYEAIRVDPTCVDAFGNLGVVYMNLNRTREAAECFAHAAAMNPKDRRAHAYWGLALLRLGKVEEAIKPLQDALRINPADQQVAVNLGWALVLTGRQEEGVAVLREAVARDPQDAKARLYLQRAEQRHETFREGTGGAGG